MGRALVIAAAVVIVVALVGFFALRALRHSTRDHRRVRAERDAAVRALRQVQEAALEWVSVYGDANSVLATTVTTEVRKFDETRRKLEETK